MSDNEMIRRLETIDERMLMEDVSVYGIAKDGMQAANRIREQNKVIDELITGIIAIEGCLWSGDTAKAKRYCDVFLAKHRSAEKQILQTPAKPGAK